MQSVCRFHLKSLLQADREPQEGDVISTWGNLGRLRGGDDPASEGSSFQYASPWGMTECFILILVLLRARDHSTRNEPCVEKLGNSLE